MYLRKHKLTTEAYYNKFFPKYDRYTGELIPFKSRDYYLNTEFVTRTNLRKWLETKAAPQEAIDYCTNFLTKRKAQKQLKYSLSHVELKSLIAPPTLCLDQILGGYYNKCKELGFIELLKSTITCYNPNELGESCGVCPSCSERIMNFMKVGIVDPIPYSIEIPWK